MSPSKYYNAIVVPKESAQAMGLNLKTLQWDVPVLKVKGTATYAGKKFLGHEFGRRTVAFEQNLAVEPRLTRGKEPFVLDYSRAGKPPKAGQLQELALRYRGFSNEGYVGGYSKSFKSRLEFPARRGILGSAYLEEFKGRVARPGKGGLKYFVGKQDVVVTKSKPSGFLVKAGKRARGVSSGSSLNKAFGGSVQVQKTVSNQSFFSRAVSSAPVVVPAPGVSSLVARSASVAGVVAGLAVKPVKAIVKAKPRARSRAVPVLGSTQFSPSSVVSIPKTKGSERVKTREIARAKPVFGSGVVPRIVSGKGTGTLQVVKPGQGAVQPVKAVQVPKQPQPVSPRSTQFLKQAVLPKQPKPGKTVTVFSPVPPPPPPPPQRFGFGLPLPKRKSSPVAVSKPSRGYRVEVGKPGRFKKQEGFYSKQAAISAGAARVDFTPATAFRLRPARSRARKETAVFYSPALLEKKFYRRKRVFVEKKKYRFDSPGEFRGKRLSLFSRKKTRLEVF